MEIIFNEVFRALGYLMISGIVYLAWKIARDNAKGGKLKKVLWQGFFWCVGIAFFASITLGNPTCIDSEQDIRGNTCYGHSDDGYEPTINQRVANFAYFMVLLYVPVALGAFNGKKEK